MWGTGLVYFRFLRELEMDLLKQTYLNLVAENCAEFVFMTWLTLIQSSLWSQSWKRSLTKSQCPTLAFNGQVSILTFVWQVPGQLYRPAGEVARGYCRPITKGYQRNTSPRYYISFIEGDEEQKKSEVEEPRVVVQMDTENPIIDQKSCLDFYFNKPVEVTGDVRVIFYQKMIGGRLFYVCFNTAFIKNSLLQVNFTALEH